MSINYKKKTSGKIRRIEETSDLPIVEIVADLLRLRSAPKPQKILLHSESSATLGWCVLTRKTKNDYCLQLDHRCGVRLTAELGSLLNVYPEINLEEDRIWIDQDAEEHFVDDAALKKHVAHLNYALSKSGTETT